MSPTSSTHNTVRTFVAVDISSELRAACQALLAEVRELPGQVRWVRPESLHITLKFLGNIPAEQIPAIEQALSAAVNQLPVFTLQSNTLGGFPSLERPRVIWLGISGDGLATLQTLQQQVEQALVPLGFEPESRPFTPHLTLGRVKAPFNLRQIVQTLQQHQFAPIAFTVREVLLMRSQLHRDGARYTPLARFPLKNNGE